MTDRQNLWFRLGFAIESARPSTLRAKIRSSERSLLRNPFFKEEVPKETMLDSMLNAGAGAVAGRVLGGGRGPGPVGLARAAAAGATATLTRSLVRVAFNLGPNEGTPDLGREVLGGAARGLLYGAVVEPRLVGSPLTRGLAFGAVEYLVAPWGGLDKVLGAASPRRTMPILGALMAVEKAPEESFTDHLIFGVALGLLYGLGRVRRGSREAE
ncbi:MAG: hypothetical protein BMS9Abin29_2051 [Gemmatimonadota bacterium]|nr:MAG: hypothetical protein BMS9Abin29_2051 [Gemmatimonadota bacterium]